MATEIQRILIKYEADIKELQKKLAEVSDAVDGVAKANKEAGQAAKKSGEEQESAAKKAGKSVGGFEAILKRTAKQIATVYSVKEIIQFTSESVKLANIQLKAEAQLLKALNGREDVQRRLLKTASDLQKQTIFGDEVIIQQQAFLASLGFSEDKINDVIAASVDLSAATGLTLEGSVRNLAKTYSGLSGELGELIPQLRGLTAEQLKNGEGVKVATELFKGQAAIIAQTGTGPIIQLQNAFGDLQEEIGKAIIEALPGFTSGLNKGVESATAFTRQLFGVEERTGRIGQVVGVVQQGFDALKQVVNNLTAPFEALFIVLGKILQNLGLVSDKSTAFDNALKIVEIAISRVGKPLQFVADLLLKVGGIWNGVIEAFRVGAETLTDVFNGIGRAIELSVKGKFGQAAEALEGFDFKAVGDAFNKGFQEIVRLNDPSVKKAAKEGGETTGKVIGDGIVEVVAKTLQSPEAAAAIKQAVNELQRQFELTEFRAKFGVDPEGVDLIGELLPVELIRASSDALSDLERQIVEVGNTRAQQSQRIIDGINAEIFAEQQREEATRQAIGSTIQIVESLGQVFANNAEAQRRIALFQIAINQALAIAEAVKAGAGLTFPANIPAILSGVAAVATAFAQVKQLEAQAPAFATGTSDAPGGLSLVGEKGPEYVSLPKGSRVFTAEASKKERSLIDALNAGRHEDFIFDHYLKPFAEKLQNSREGWGYDDFQLRQAVRSNKTIELGPKTIRKLSKGQKKVFH